MIYLVSKQQKLFNSDFYKIINTKQALDIINNWKIIYRRLDISWEWGVRWLLCCNRTGFAEKPE